MYVLHKANEGVVVVVVIVNENGTVKQNNRSDFRLFQSNQSHCRKVKYKNAIV